MKSKHVIFIWLQEKDQQRGKLIYTNVLGRKNCEAILGLHAFTWIKAFLSLEQDSEIVVALAALGVEKEPPSLETCVILEKFTCMVYLPKSSKRTLK